MSNITRVNRGDTLLGKIVDYDRLKSSDAILEDFSVGKVLQPSIVKLRDEDCWSLYRGNEWIMSAVNRIVADCIKVTPKIAPKDKTRKMSGRLSKRIAIIQDFLDNPNNNKESFFEVREKVIRDLLIYGRGTMEKKLSGSRRLVEVYGVCSKNIKLQADQHGTLPDSQAYRYEYTQSNNPNNQPIFFDIDEMIFMVLHPCSATAYGLKTLDGIANAVAADILRSAFNANYFVNGAEANGLMSLEGLSKSELKKFRDYWQTNFKGAKNAHKTAVVNVPVNYVRMAITNRDLQFAEYGVELRTKIFAAYNIPPFIMGIVDQNTGKLNSGQQVELYKDGALRPILNKEAYYYTKEIIQMGFGFSDLEVTFPALDLIDVMTQSTIDIAEANAGIVVINEIRNKRGMPPVRWGDTPISVMPGGGQVDPNSGKLIPPSKTNGASKKGLFDDHIQIIKNKIEAIIYNFGDFGIDPNVKLQEVTHDKILYANDNKFVVKRYQLPVELKHGRLYDILEQLFEIKGEQDVRTRYLECVGTHIKHIVYDNILKGNLNNILIEIDRIVHEEKLSEIYKEIF